MVDSLFLWLVLFTTSTFLCLFWNGWIIHKYDDSGQTKHLTFLKSIWNVVSKYYNLKLRNWKWIWVSANFSYVKD